MNIELVSTVLFILAILHTFLAGKIEWFARSVFKRRFLLRTAHYLSEVELIFPFWGIIFLLIFICYDSKQFSAHLGGLNFKECLFVFVIMTMSSNRLVITAAKKFLLFFSSLLPLDERLGFFLVTLIVGPLLGSLITEPGAMTVCAALLVRTFYREGISLKFKYAMLALLFVNISVGGTLTHFAAPPVLMVAAKWKWDTLFMLTHFGWKSFLIIVINTIFYACFFNRELKGNLIKEKEEYFRRQEWISVFAQVVLIALCVFFAHHIFVLVGIFSTSFFLSKKSDLGKVKEAVYVSAFLFGLIVLGSMQAWWLKNFISGLDFHLLFLGSAALTSVADNAAITYLGSMGELSEAAKYALVAGAISGGGLTVIANAPNPAGYGLLKERFPNEQISALQLFIWALLPTSVACLVFFLL